MKLGMVGLPNVGKSTLFNALTNAGAESANYPFCTIEKNVGIVSVPDARLDKLAEMYEPDKFTPATLEFVDIAGLVKGASKGEGLGNKFLGDIREVDAIVHVVRCFEDENIIHVDGRINPASDIETINLELIFSDIEMVARRIDRTKKALKGDKKLQAQVDFLERLQAHLEEGKSARGFDFTEDELSWIHDMPLLSAKPVIYAANMSEEDFRNGVDKNEHYQEVKQIAEAEHAAVLPICAKIEEDIADMEADDKAMTGGIRSEPHHPGGLFSAGSHLLSDRRQAGSPCMDHHQGNESAPGCRKDPHRFRKGIHPCRSCLL